MFEIHTTKTGDSMLIFQMDDQHLINTVLLRLRRMEDCRRVLDTDFPKLDPMLQYSMPKEFTNETLRKKAADEFKRQHKALLPYLLAVVLRGLETRIKGELNKAYGNNNGRLPQLNLQSLPSSDEDGSAVYDISDMEF